MIKACDLKKTSVIDIDGTPHVIENMSQQAPTARGGNTLYKVRFRNISTGQKVDKTFRGDDALQETSYETKQVQYLYKDGDRYTFELPLPTPSRTGRVVQSRPFYLGTYH